MNDDNEFQAMIINAMRFIIESINDGNASFNDAMHLDEASIEEFGDEYEFTIDAYHNALDLIKSIRAL